MLRDLVSYCLYDPILPWTQRSTILFQSALLPCQCASIGTKQLHLHLAIAEMVTYLPLSSPTIRLAGRFVDEAFGVAAGYNFFVSQVAQIPFEIVACNLIITYWSDAVPVGAIVAIVLVLYMYVFTYCKLSYAV